MAKVDDERRGIAMGIAQGRGSSLMGFFVAPVVLVGFATAHGWRHAFFLADAPASVTSDASRGSLAALGLRETAPRALAKAATR